MFLVLYDAASIPTEILSSTCQVSQRVVRIFDWHHNYGLEESWVCTVATLVILNCDLFAYLGF